MKLIPGKVRFKGACCVPNVGEHRNTNYEALCGYNVIWIPRSHGSVPDDALPAGIS